MAYTVSDRPFCVYVVLSCIYIFLRVNNSRISRFYMYIDKMYIKQVFYLHVFAKRRVFSDRICQYAIKRTDLFSFCKNMILKSRSDSLICGSCIFIFLQNVK